MKIPSSLKFFFYSSGLALCLNACGTTKTVSKKRTAGKPITKTVALDSGLRRLNSNYTGANTKKIDNLIKDAQKYLGSPYRFGGTTASGFDCSGFTLVVYQQNEYKLPRRSSDQALVGDKIDIRQVKPGDLLFFATSGGKKVSHVGIVQDIGVNGEVKFIHASTSKGVIVSSLNEKYWNKAYLHARRVL